tara:strand:- start:144 stop:392 length:249 start_codon:yes stop_codon:yes gene_type:complete
MSVEYTKPTENLVARACKITIDKSLPNEPQIILNYTNDKDDLGKIVTTPTQIVEQGILTLEEVELMEANFKKLADAISPVVG